MAEPVCIILAGAPDAQDLEWKSSDLTAVFETPIQRFLDDCVSPAQRAISQPSATFPKWRLIPMDQVRLAARRTYQEDLQQTQFLSFEHEADKDDEQERLQFLQDSLFQLNELESSEIADLEETSLYPSTYPAGNTTSTTSFGSTTNGSFSSNSLPDVHGPSAATGAGIIITGDIIDLKRIPPASHITRIHPQTLTVTILAAVISVAASRTVRLRKQAGKEMDIMEVLLGDETRAGFSVSFWLVPAESQHKPQDDMRDQLLDLRAGDVVLVQNIALQAWKGCVYGQSLSRRFARNSTRVVVLSKDVGLRIGRVIQGKIERVETWSSEFVGRRDGRLRTQGPGKDQSEVLPPDTQSPVKR